jgi:hypothetical protein
MALFTTSTATRFFGVKYLKATSHVSDYTVIMGSMIFSGIEFNSLKLQGNLGLSRLRSAD